jgi:hypothetical protein
VYGLSQSFLYSFNLATLDAWRARIKSDTDSFEDAPFAWDPAQWRVRSDSPGYVKRADGRDYGADVGRVGRTAP